MMTVSREDGSTLQCEHCGHEHQSGLSFCPVTGKITRPERFFPRGTVIGDKYRLASVLGSGGMGAVFEATHTMLQKRVAVKLMLPEMAADRELMSRMVREARTASATGHRNVVAVTDMGWTREGALFLVMEYLEGRTLRALIKEEGPQPPERAAQIVFQVLSAVIAVHERGIVHRDLKPDNVMIVVGDEGEELVKVLDFGISKVLHSEQVMQLTRTGSVLGSPRYMAPEQAQGGQIDQRTDIYAVGGILYSLLAGRPPLRASNFTAMVAAILRGEIKPPSTYAPGISPTIDEITLKALARAPDARYPDARTFRHDLRPFLGASSGGYAEVSVSLNLDLAPSDSRPSKSNGAAAINPPPGGLASRIRGGRPDGGSNLDVSLELDEASRAKPPEVDSLSRSKAPVAGDPVKGARLRPPAELTGSGLVEPAELPGSKLGKTDEQATLLAKPLARMTSPKAVSRAKASAGDDLAGDDLAGDDLAGDVGLATERDREPPGALEAGLEPLAASIGSPARDAARGQELELDIEDNWRQGQAEKYGDAARYARPAPQAKGTLYANRGSAGRIVQFALVGAVLVAVGLVSWLYRATVLGWFGARSEPDAVLILIETRPKRATVFVDGVQQVRRSVQLPRSQREHIIRVQAPGYWSKRVSVRADATQRVDVRLDRRRKKGAKAP